MANQFIDNFFKELSPVEEKIIARYLKNNLQNSEHSKTLEIFYRLKKGEKQNSVNQSAFNKIKSRLIESCLNSLMLEDYLADENFNIFDKTFIELKRQLLHCQILFKSRNASKIEVIRHLLNKIINDAKNVEAYPVLIEALIIRKYLFGPKANLTKFNKTNNEIEHYQYCLNSLYKANDSYFIYLYSELHEKSSDRKKLIQLLTSFIKQTRHSYSKTKSEHINYYLHILTIWHHEKKKEFKKAIFWCHKLNQLLSQKKQIFRPDRQAIVYQHLSLYYVYNADYLNAKKTNELALSGFLPNAAHHARCEAQNFEIQYYAGKFSKAYVHLKKILKYRKTTFVSFEFSKWHYYEICLFFQLKKYKQALILLSKPLEIEKDKERWNIAVRILNIMINIELKDITMASRQLTALRKFLQRNKTNDKISKRDRLIIETLRELEKNEFIFRKENIIIGKKLKQLSAKNTKVAWEHYTPEMIKFHEWLASKTKKSRQYHSNKKSS